MFYFVIDAYDGLGFLIRSSVPLTFRFARGRRSEACLPRSFGRLGTCGRGGGG